MTDRTYKDYILVFNISVEFADKPIISLNWPEGAHFLPSKESISYKTEWIEAVEWTATGSDTETECSISFIETEKSLKLSWLVWKIMRFCKMRNPIMSERKSSTARS